MSLEPRMIVLLVGVAVYTLIALIIDVREKRIPNWLTLPMFAAGWIFQVAFRGWSGLGDGALGFLIGFGILFLLWMVGSGGGGDVKFMGALSVWLGWQRTLFAMIASTVVVILLTLAITLFAVFRHGARQTQQKYIATRRPDFNRAEKRPETSHDKKQRRVMAYAIPVSIATWLLMAWEVIRLSNAH